MPNGDHDFDDRQRPELERLFAPLASRLEAFATRHHLLLEKYPKQNHAWHFSFRLPAGGTGLIQVLLAPSNSVRVVAARNLLEFERFRASSYTWNRGTIARDDPGLPELLVSLLKEILALPAEKLVPTGVDYSPYWRGESPGTLRGHEESLPLPIVD